jgi:deoxycytidylate deaminase
MAERHNHYLNKLSDIACNIESFAAARLSAYLVYKNSVISVGFNKNKTHPLQAQYSKNSEAIYIHAEIDAILNAIKNFDDSFLKKCTLYICRVKKAQVGAPFERGLAKPCDGCFRAIKAYGIKKVVYSIDNFSYGVIDCEY